MGATNRNCFCVEKVNQLPIARYMFFPDGGDLDFQSVEEATEQGCIDIKAGSWIYRLFWRTGEG